MTPTAHALPQHRQWRLRTHEWRRGLSVPKKLALALGMAGLTGLLAQVGFRVQMWTTPVPITGQVFAVLLAGVLCGSGYGALSQVFYVGLGAVGLPWFAGWGSGFGALTGASGGYLIGFVVAAAVIGAVTDRSPASRSFWPQFVLMMGGVLVIYIYGAVQFAFVLRTGLRDTLLGAVIPFVFVDAVKAWLAAGISSKLLLQPADGEHADAA